ncbi:hypothetical protein HCN44_009419 [Aphidius gifuensis]|uniref:Uncharacterized protein n=1 Tax=Aphidius gifuensis TaxID=684658 RepID=A0A834Y3R5_APHGI|nr:leucine-rich repeat-containing protein 15-like [Aphidius gifuensis]KAF7998021.1 hypothetical protein HCN44_009419 [Aphidius gifuensis]
MALSRLGIILLTLTVSLVNCGDMGEQACPIDCECHYFRINWITDCSESNLTSIPYDELSPNVYILDMNSNRIEHIDTFPKDIKLRGLQMAHNRITKLNSTTFKELQYLVEADFSSNLITKIDPDAFKESHGLITLELHNNPLDDVDEPFLDCKSLTYLDLSNCGIKKLHNSFFNNTTKLNKLDLSGNPLIKIQPGPFDNLLNLEYLKLNNCSINYIDSRSFKNLESLRELELSNNSLSSINWTSVLEPLIRLEYLNIANTDIRKLPGDAFAQNHYLRHLDLSNNILHHLDIEYTLGHNLHNLQILDLSYCALQDRLSEETFGNSSKLQKLNLSGNSMFAADELAAVLKHMPKLTELSLSNCSLKKLPDAFNYLHELRTLDISYNAMSDAFVRLLTPLKSLEYLDMSYCNLGYVGKDTFSYMTELKELILSGNELDTLERDLFANLTKLKRLELKNCHFRTPLDTNVFGEGQLSNLIELSLSGNPLAIPKTGSLLSEQLSSVEKLDLSNCSITKLNDNIFLYNDNITELNLSGNKLTGDLGFLKNLTRLTNLNLSHNNLTTVKPDIFNNNKQLLKLNLIGNPFVCNCSIVEIWNWATDKIKGKDLYDFLIGSQPTEFGTGVGKLGAVKGKKILSCVYDNETYKKITANKMQERNGKSISRKGDFTQYRTWAKYIRESNCNSTS